MKRLNFGCGRDIKQGWDNVDIQKDSRLTKSFDFDKFPYPLKDNSYDYVLMSQVIEHLEKPDKALLELHRIIKPNGIIRIETCYFNNIAMTNDMQHKHYFSEKTFQEFVRQPCVINKQKMFEIKLLELQPTLIGKFLPKKIREKLCMIIGGLIGKIYVELKIIKN